ncbi:hypothetical protein [Acinetobacter sp. ANC5681]|uniref:ImmA/IrrE family metallo-endopeptidase n=1 Tax=Acinetobacter sp. ANC5681 TaxID=2929504 RepID=UPI00201AF6A0|nr:hypothetical protein [Acinetobacter sp. ANC5681]MCL5767349.1 hypothetical protein [Acinetobacter sp. ANC5681]
MDSIFWARKLTLERTNQFVQDNKVRKSWMANDFLTQVNKWGINYPAEIVPFNLASVTNQAINHMIMSYVKIGQNGKTQILVNDINNFCWKRFYILKEIVHVVSSNIENTTIGTDRIAEVLTNLHDKNFDFLAQDKALLSEVEAGWGAIELLLTKEIVEKEEAAVGGYKNLTDKHITDIAHKYRVPKVVVRARFTNEACRSIYDTAYKSTLYQNAQFMPIYKR